LAADAGTVATVAICVRMVAHKLFKDEVASLVFKASEATDDNMLGRGVTQQVKPCKYNAALQKFCGSVAQTRCPLRVICD
jgi:hypothetical protein